MSFHSVADARVFVTAGNAIITLESHKTGVHFTYRVRQAKDDHDRPVNRWFVSVLTGPDNENDYRYIGMLSAKADILAFCATKGSKISCDAPSFRAFDYFWTAVLRGTIPSCLEVRHEGRCGRCARTLTVPESVDSGFGPECITKVKAA